jgi:DNA-binding NarL/FixJ family response regulator
MTYAHPDPTAPSGSAARGVDPPIRLALLDDHELLLDALSTWIEKNAPEFDLVVRAGSWLELVHSDAFPTDLVIMDLQLKETVSIGARLRTCRAAGAKVVVLSAVDTPEDRDAALAAGAVAYVTKSQPMSELVAAALSAVGRGVVRTASAQPAWRPKPLIPDSARPRLSDGERQALVLYAYARSTARPGVQPAREPT